MMIIDMTINIIKEGEIYLTEAEHKRLRRDYQALCQYQVSPLPFETFCRFRKEIWDQTIESQRTRESKTNQRREP